MLTMVVSCTLVLIHSISAPSGDCLLADHVVFVGDLLKDVDLGSGETFDVELEKRQRWGCGRWTV